jgi:hypothetical protein
MRSRLCLWVCSMACSGRIRADGASEAATHAGSSSTVDVERFRHGGDPTITLYHQDTDPKNGDLKFTDITKTADLTRKGWGMGIAVAS